MDESQAIVQYRVSSAQDPDSEKCGEAGVDVTTKPDEESNHISRARR